MAPKNQIVVFVTGDTKDADRSLAEVEARLGKLGNTADKVGAKMSNAGRKMTLFVTAPVLAGIGAATKAASDLQQSVGAVESIFGDAGKPIEAFAETAAQSAGLSKREVNEMASVLGAQLQGLGYDVDVAVPKVIELEKRAADLAATFGGPTSQALDAISGVLRGERDPIERYGVSLKQADVDARAMALGLDTSTASAKKHSDAMASLDLLMEQTANSSGQFAREQDSAAGASARARAELENAAASLGDHLLPMAAKAADKVAFLAAEFTKMPSAVQSGILALGGIAAASGPILRVAGSVSNLRARLVEAGSAGVTANRAIGAIGKASVVIGVIYAVKAGIDALSGSTKQLSVDVSELARETTADLLDSYKQAVAEARSLNPGAAIPGQAEMAVFAKIARDSLPTARRLRDAIKASGGDVSDLDFKLREETEAQKRASDAAVDGASAIDGVGDSATGAAPKVESFTDALAKTLGAHLALEGAQGDLSDASDKLAADLADVGDSASESTEQVRTFQDAMHDGFDSVVAVDEATVDYADSLDALQEALNGVSQGSETAAEFMERFYKGGAKAAGDQGRAVTRATAAAVKAAEAEVDAMVESGQVADTAEARKAALRDKLVDLEEQFPAVKTQIDRYISSLDKVPNLTTHAEDSTKKLSTAKKNLREDLHNVIKAAEDEATAMEGNGTEIDKATRHHFALLTILTDLQKQFPLLAGVIQDYVNDVNDAYEDFLLQQVGGPDALARSFAPGSFGAPTSTSSGATSTSTSSGAPGGVHLTQYISGEGLNAEEVGTVVARKTKNALVGSRAA